MLAERELTFEKVLKSMTGILTGREGVRFDIPRGGNDIKMNENVRIHDMIRDISPGW